MNHYLALITLFFIGQMISTDSFMPINSKRCTTDNCRLDEYVQPTPKLKKIVRDLLKKTEKIKNILIYPEPDDKEDWESGEIPWEPRNVNESEIYKFKRFFTTTLPLNTACSTSNRLCNCCSRRRNAFT